MQDAERFIGIPFPEDARDIQTAFLGALDELLYVRMALPDDVIEPYIETLGFTRPLDENRQVTKNFDELDWWRPDDLPATLDGRTKNGSDKRDFVLRMEDSDSDFRIVYLQAY